MPKVFVINRSNHDYSKARKYGQLHFLSDGPMDKYQVANMDRQFREKLADSRPDDFILVTSLTVMCSVACVIFAMKHNRLNLLLYNDANRGEYAVRKLCYDQVCEKENN